MVLVLICPLRKYSFKVKKQKVSDDTVDLALEESVRTISALFSQTVPRSAECSGSDEPLESRVASISAEIAAAIAQASSRGLDGEDEAEEDEIDDEDGEGWSGSGNEMVMANTSGIRDSGDKGVVEDDEDSDTFPIPLRTRKGKDSAAVVGTKRKR